MSDEYNRDPGASVDDAGIPEVADDRTPGSGDVPEPELPTVPTDQPVAATAYGVTASEQQQGTPLDERLAAEEPDELPPPDVGTGMHVEEPPS
ncbi:MAG: hypothetical protein ICV70_04925 [Jiangellaceae bacterium]|nr:hypothetical protein [Jiangellaceae bacterium]